MRYAYVIRCDEVIYNETGGVSELRCTYDPATRSGAKAEGRKVKGIIHWVSAKDSIQVEVRLYDRRFSKPIPGSDDTEGNFLNDINQDSIEVLSDCQVEPGIMTAENQEIFQFERVGYFYRDPVDSLTEALVFNRTVTLRDTWAKLELEQN